MDQEKLLGIILVVIFVAVRLREGKTGKKITRSSTQIHTGTDYEIFPGVSRNAFCHGLHLVESKRDNYTAYNSRTSALGRYQFLPKYFRDDIVRITGARDHQHFLSTPEYQETFMDHHISTTLIPGVQKLQKKYKNTVYSEVELLSLVHFLGASGASDFIQNKQMNPDQQVGNVSAEKYLEIVKRGVREKS